MGKRILLATQRERLVGIARELLPPGFSLEVLETGESEAVLVAALGRADYLMGFTHRHWSSREYDAAASLKLIQLFGAGYDQIDQDEVARIGLPVCNCGGANSTAVAEHAVLLMLAVYRRLPTLDRSVRADGWAPPDGTGFPEMEGKLIGLVGLGMIGRKVARMLRGFDVRLQYFDARRLSAEDEAVLGLTFVPFAELLRTSDVVTLQVPLNAETDGLIGASELRSMKPDAVLINTCRGEVVDEAALYHALANGTLAGAGLDVFEEEPVSADSPLLGLDNVALTPHVAGASIESWRRRLRIGYENFERVERGEQPLWLVAGPRQAQRGMPVKQLSSNDFSR